MGGGVNLFFDDFMDNQNICYSLLKNSVATGRVSHAYLVDANNNDDAYDFVIAFVKMLLCPYGYSCYLKNKCNDCHLCQRIQDGNYSEIKVIEAESNVIKKEQLLELQNEFSRTNLEGKYRIYIIRDCDKMNKHAANSLLKFLEEPVDGIIAILMTNHFSKVLSTIVSRCQIVHLKHVMHFNNISSFDNLASVCCDNNEAILEFCRDDNKKDIMNTVIDFILYFEENGVDILLYMKKMWYNKIHSRDECIFAFQIMINFYYDVLKSKMNGDVLFCSHKAEINRVANLNTFDILVKKIDIIHYGYDMILSNLNVNLLLDDIVIRMGDVHEHS